MINFESFDQQEIRKRSEFAYTACQRLAETGDLVAFCDTVEGPAEIEWHPSLVKVYFSTVCVDVYINEINGAVEGIYFFE